MKNATRYQFSIAAVIHPKGKDEDLLLVRKRRNDGRGWQLPAGKALPHETLRQTALREIKEETKLPRKKMRLHSSKSFGLVRAVLFNSAKRKIIIVVEASLKTKKAPRPNKEIKESRYFGLGKKALSRHWSKHVRSPLVRDRLNTVVLSLLSGQPQLLEFRYANGLGHFRHTPYLSKGARPLTKVWLRNHGVDGFVG